MPPDERGLDPNPRRGSAPRVWILIPALLGIPAGAAAQVSPGPLSRAHENLEGNLKCFHCHGAASGEMAGKCLACHAEIAWLAERGRGLHGLPGHSECASCHPDHAGRDFDLIDWGEGGVDGFHHGRAGWPLLGKHAQIRCNACHKESLRVSPAASLAPHGKKERWTGLEVSCGSCHQDVHKGSLGPDCSRCHAQRGWVPTVGFDHAATDFPLTGRHAAVACERCHRSTQAVASATQEGATVRVFRPLAHETCSACHQDVHQGRLGTDCSRCHGTDSFRSVSREAFDHDRTAYPLRGAHRGIECARCHDPEKAWGARPDHATCGSCHRDAHAGTATLAGKAVDCATCHDVAGWAPARFDLKAHERTRYPLQGRHRNIACRACHVKTIGASAGKLGTAGILIRAPFGHCLDCHRDAHRGQLDTSPGGPACEACHDVSGFSPSHFTIENHTRTPFPLDGRHAKIECALCHGPHRRGLPPLPPPDTLGSAHVALKLSEHGCADCHFDPHGGRYQAGSGTGKACEKCHDTAHFVPAHVDVTAHGSFDYPLEGAHRTVPCSSCHAELSKKPATTSLIHAAVGVRPLTFREAHAECVDCHRSPHGNRFDHRPDRNACGACHGLDGFRPSIFDHEHDSRFPLAGAHARVACARCHPTRRDQDGEERMVFRGVPVRCEACHSHPPKEPAPPGPAGATPP